MLRSNRQTKYGCGWYETADQYLCPALQMVCQVRKGVDGEREWGRRPEGRDKPASLKAGRGKADPDRLAICRVTAWAWPSKPNPVLAPSPFPGYVRAHISSAQVGMLSALPRSRQTDRPDRRGSWWWWWWWVAVHEPSNLARPTEIDRDLAPTWLFPPRQPFRFCAHRGGPETGVCSSGLELAGCERSHTRSPIYLGLE